MPLFTNAERTIRDYLAAAAQRRPMKPRILGELTAAQLADLNRKRSAVGLEPMSGKVFFRGRHIYESRIVRDGYSIDDVLSQIVSAFSDTSVIRFTGKMTVLQSTARRPDLYGNSVQDEIVLECTSGHPNAELFSVIPKGDQIKPKR